MLKGYLKRLGLILALGFGMIWVSGQALAQGAAQVGFLRATCASAPLRPGQPAALQVSWRNDGPATAKSAVGTLALDPALQVVDAAGGIATAEGLLWSLGDLAGQAHVTRTVVVRVPEHVPVGTALRFRAGAAGEGLTRSTATALTFKVTDVTAVNDKLAWDMYGNDADGPTDATTSNIIYMIRFQNTGADTVTSVYVRDTLDSDLDPSTLTVGGSSHMMSTNINGSAVEFYFPGIYLPDSASSPLGSLGYVTFNVNLDPGLPVGTVILNRASVTFDSDPAFSTNTIVSALCPSLQEDFSFTQSGMSYNFTDLSANDAISWQWNFGDGTTSTARNPSHTYGTFGNYNVCLTVSSLCRTEIVCKQLLLVGGPEANVLQGLHVSSNPGNGHYVISGDLQGRGILQIRAFDAMGKMVWEHDELRAPGTVEIEADLSHFGAGIYTLVMEYGGKSLAVKLMKP